MMCGAVASGFLLALLPVFIFSFFSQNMLFSGVIHATNLSLQESIPAAKKGNSAAVLLGPSLSERYDRTFISCSVGLGCKPAISSQSGLPILPANLLGKFHEKPHRSEQVNIW